MRFQLRKCVSCHAYTLKVRCPKCDDETRLVHPAKFSPDDRYLRYRSADNYQGTD